MKDEKIEKLKALNDEELALLSKTDEIAMDILFSRYKEMIRSKTQLYFIFGADQDDIIQEGSLGFFKAIQSYDKEKGAAFKTFAEVCVNRCIISAVQRAARKKYAPLNTALSLDNPVSLEEPDQTLGDTLAAGLESNPEAQFIFAEISEQILSPHSKILSSFERQVFKYLYEGKDYKQIAEILEKPPKSIDNAIQRIRSKLKNFLID